MFALAIAPCAAVAQDDGEIVELSPFVVDSSQDVGYRATNSTSGTSLNTAIKDLPMAIEVINQEFIEDTGATSFEEALAYSSGVFLNQYTQSAATSDDGANAPGANEVSSADRSPSSRGGVGGRFDNVTIIRGFNVPFQNRDGFRYGGLIAQYGTVLGGVIDTSNVERMEVVRGPNSLLYGIGVLSGIVNVIPKRPLPAQRTSVSLGFGNQGYLRGTFDTTGPIAKDFMGGDWAYRVSATKEERESWTQYASKDLEFYVGQLQYTNPKLTVFLELQHAFQQDNGIGSRQIYDNLNAAIDQNFRNEFGEQYNWTKDYGSNPESVRITGPDTYEFRRETDILANVDYTPNENFTISFGAFHTDAKQEEFNVNLSTLTNSERSFDLKGVLVQRLNDPNTEDREELQNWIDTYVTRFPYTGEVQPGDLRDLDDYRTMRYWWYKSPEFTTTEQYRLRMTYSTESRFLFDSTAKHRFLVGRHDIKDEIDLTEGRERIDWQYAFKGEILDNDPLLFRNIFDQSVIRYNGEQLAEPGLEYRHVDNWFTGHYALYQGNFFEDKLSVILGARHDRYRARDRQYDRFDEQAAFGPDYDGPNLVIGPSSEVQDNPNNQTFGFFPPPEGVSEYLPSPEGPETDITETIAANYKINAWLTVYGLRSEGLTPNTGARDGNLEGIESEKSTSSELGIKFGSWESKLSGTVSVYKIKRDNALWNFSAAPAPANWVGGVVHPTNETGPDNGFEPDKVADGTLPLSYGVDQFYFSEEGVTLGKVRRNITDDNGNVIGREIVFPDGLLGIEGQRSDTTNPRNIVYLDYSLLDEPAIAGDGTPTGKNWRYYIEQAFADRSRSASDFRAQAGPDDFDPMFYGRTRGTILGVNSSLNNATGANVTYEDEATGYDMQLIYAPTPNLQLLFSYAHTEREATSSFSLVDVIDPESGVGFGTEYDVWVRTFGREAFGLTEEDTDGDGVVDTVTKGGQPLSMGDVSPLELAGGLEGVSLYTGSEDSASLWTKYSFTEGRLNGFQAGLGVIYTGPAATSIPIGGSDLAANQFGTPPTEERYQVNSALKYQWKSQGLDWSAKLNVYNITNSQKGESVVAYLDNGVPTKRRTDVYYSPTTYRFSLGVTF